MTRLFFNISLKMIVGLVLFLNSNVAGAQTTLVDEQGTRLTIEGIVLEPGQEHLRGVALGIGYLKRYEWADKETYALLSTGAEIGVLDDGRRVYEADLYWVNGSTNRDNNIGFGVESLVSKAQHERASFYIGVGPSFYSGHGDQNLNALIVVGHQFDPVNDLGIAGAGVGVSSRQAILNGMMNFNGSLQWGAGEIYGDDSDDGGPRRAGSWSRGDITGFLRLFQAPRIGRVYAKSRYKFVKFNYEDDIFEDTRTHRFEFGLQIVR